MAINGAPFKHSVAHCVGTASGVEMTVPGIRASDVLLAVITHSHGVTPAAAAGLDPTGWTVTDDAIAKAVDNTNLKVTVIWSHEN
jgi:hypothetical protein